MNQGSEHARVLKLADRLSNITSLFYVEDTGFVLRYLNETKNYIVPYASYINKNMAMELQNLLNIHTKKHLKS